MKPITDIMREIRKGALVDAATDELAELVRAVQATGKAGTITIKIKVNPLGRDSKQVELIPNISLSAPSPDLAKGIFFVDGQGDLLRDDPEQRPLFEETAAGGARGPGAIAN